MIMLDTTDLQRLAAMAHALRPDWPAKSLHTYLHATHAKRPYRDLAAALAYVAADPASRTPKRLEEPGPWWQIGRIDEPTPAPASTRSLRCARCGRWVTEPDHDCTSRADPETARRLAAQAKAAIRRAAT